MFNSSFLLLPLLCDMPFRGAPETFVIPMTQTISSCSKVASYTDVTDQPASQNLFIPGFDSILRLVHVKIQKIYINLSMLHTVHGSEIRLTS